MTGYTEVDKLLGGLQPSDLILVGSRPTVGKTAFVLNVAWMNAGLHGVPTAFFSLGQSALTVERRMLSIMAGVAQEKELSGVADSDERQRLNKAREELSALPIHFDSTLFEGFPELEDSCRAVKMEKDIGLLIIDDIYLLSKVSSFQSRARSMPGLAKKLSNLAGQLNMPVMATVYLSHSVERRKDKRPRLIDLPAYLTTEKHCDVVILLHREAVYEPTPRADCEETVIEVHVAKNRNAGLGVCKLAFCKDKSPLTCSDPPLK